VNQNVNITYHEVDFLLPVHRFNIRFSYVTKKGLPFIREFLLRLVHISPIKPADVASYFGLSKREADEAIRDLVDKGDLRFLDNGLIDLTSMSHGYFVGLGSTPLVSSLLESGGVFAFELAGFNCVGRKRTNERWVLGLPLKVPNETLANSERLVKRKFQESFHVIQEKGFWEHRSFNDEPGRPSIYTMESVRKLGQEPLRLTCMFAIDQSGIPVERDYFDILDDSSAVQELVTDVLASAQKPMNLNEIGQAMAAFEDQKTKTLFNDHSINPEKLMLGQQAGQLDDGKWLPFVGPLYSKENWELLIEVLNQQLAVLKECNETSPEFLWIAPSDSFWGKSLRVSACFGHLVDLSTSKGKKPIQRYHPKFYLPVQDSDDRRAISRWKQEFSDWQSYTHGFVEGFMDGNVEVLLLPGYMAVICYHISRPEIIPASLPVGYITTDVIKIEVITRLVQDYINGVISFDNPRDLGPLREL
jgi:hypothetical protein